jgi:uncharacterized linocin/CFP29 family protein
MADTNSGLRWSDAQWEKVNSAVTEAFNKASIAAAFLPCYGPLPESADYVRDEKLVPAPAMVTVTDNDTVKLFNLTVNVELSREQVAEEALSSAFLAFRRAADSLAQVEDHLVFNGHGSDQVAAQAALGSASKLPTLTANNAPVLVVGSGPATLSGLIGPKIATEIVQSIRRRPTQPAPPTGRRRRRARTGRSAAGGGTTTQGQIDGDHIVAEVSRSVVALEAASHPGPFACILGPDAFVAAQTPATGLVLPADRITPILNGPLLRSGQMAPNAGIVVSLASNDIDIVVATPPKVQFLQVTARAKYLFRVYEKFVWRIKDPTTVSGFGI